MSDAFEEDATPDEVRAAREMNRWYGQAHNAAVALWTMGIPGPEISEVLQQTFGLKKTKSAVIGKMFRAGLAYEGPRSNGPGKGLGRGRTGASLRRHLMPTETLERIREKDRVRERERRAKLKALRGPTPPRVPKPGRLVAQAWSEEGASPEPTPFVPRAPKPKLVDTEVRESLRVPLWEIREGMCRYIADDPLVDSSMCGHQALSGSPWCPGHHALCCEGRRPAGPPPPLALWLPEIRMTRRLINLVDEDTRQAVLQGAVWVSILLALAGVAHLFSAFPASHPAQSAQTQGDRP